MNLVLLIGTQFVIDYIKGEVSDLETYAAASAGSVLSNKIPYVGGFIGGMGAAFVNDILKASVAEENISPDEIVTDVAYGGVMGIVVDVLSVLGEISPGTAFHAFDIRPLAFLRSYDKRSFSTIIDDLARAALGINSGDYQDILDLLNSYFSDDRQDCFNQ